MIYKPYKIIYKYRNANRKFQYFYYIFLGSQPNNIKKIIVKFTNLTFFETLLELSPDEIEILEKHYDEYWYENFFINEHLKKSKKIFLSSDKNHSNRTGSSSTNNAILKKMGNEWVEKHIKTIKKSNLVYSYNGKIKIERLKKQFDEEKNQLGGDITSEDVPFLGNEEEEQELDLESDLEPDLEPDLEQNDLIEEFDAANLEEMHLINEDIDNEAEKTKKQLDNI